MRLNCGIVGLPNVGKSTLFSTLTRSEVDIANYPFCTIDPNVGIVELPSEDLTYLKTVIQPRQLIPAVVEFVDIAGLIKGASIGEGLGNAFLSHIRQVGLLIHVVRCFQERDVVHVDGDLNPLRDRETIHYELCMSDLERVERRLQNAEKMRKSLSSKDDKKTFELMHALLLKLKETLSSARSVRDLALSEDEKPLLRELELITAKPMLYVCNVDEGDPQENELFCQFRDAVEREEVSVLVLPICARLESEIAALSTQELRAEFMESMGLERSGLDRLIEAAYQLLGLRTYYTAGEKEVRAWTFLEGTKAPQAAGLIHSDFEHGFIRAEVYHVDDLRQCKGQVAELKKKGLLRMEGKNYTVCDGDVMLFHFSV